MWLSLKGATIRDETRVIGPAVGPEAWPPLGVSPPEGRAGGESWEGRCYGQFEGARIGASQTL